MICTKIIFFGTFYHFIMISQQVDTVILTLVKIPLVVQMGNLCFYQINVQG